MRDLLIRSDLNSSRLTPGSYACKQNCLACKFMENSNEFKSTITSKRYKIQGHHTCKTPSVVYLITCTKCKIQYVGQTGNTIRERLYGHMADIRAKNTFKPVSRHFGTEHDVTNISITIIQNTERNLNKRLRSEELWIKKLATKTPDGLNLM